VPPPVPPAGRNDGASNVPVTGEISGGEPVGLGPRVPLLVMSPWTRGGWVCSELFDHTSVLRFLEQRFGVAEPNISPWRRSVCGDLTSMFDFTRPDNSRPEHLFKVGYRASIERADRMCRGQKAAQLPTVQALPVPERAPGVDGTRPARPLPYRLQVDGAIERAGERFRIGFENAGKSGAAFTVYAPHHNAGPWYYTVAAYATLDDYWPLAGFKDGKYELRVDGPDGLLRLFRGSAAGRAEATPRALAGELVLKLENGYDRRCRFSVTDRSYGAEARTVEVPAGQSATLAWPAAASHGWYDVELALDLDPGFGRRFAGHLDSGAACRSDPAIGSAARQR
jgi:phospholipase C